MLFRTDISLSFLFEFYLVVAFVQLKFDKCIKNLNLKCHCTGKPNFKKKTKLNYIHHYIYLVLKISSLL